MEKKCYTCGEVKKTSDFNKNKSRKDGLNSICRACSQARSRQYYQENREYHKTQIGKRRVEQRRRNQEYVFKYLSESSCVDCGLSGDPVVLEFDHTRDKRKAVSMMVASNCSIKSIQEEIDKCEVRCANCHRRKTARDQNHYTYRMLQEKRS
jgi:5-methylcytosine-specific restriction endonuclease McrA